MGQKAIMKGEKSRDMQGTPADPARRTPVPQKQTAGQEASMKGDKSGDTPGTRHTLSVPQKQRPIVKGDKSGDTPGTLAHPPGTLFFTKLNPYSKLFGEYCNNYVT